MGGFGVNGVGFTPPPPRMSFHIALFTNTLSFVCPVGLLLRDSLFFAIVILLYWNQLRHELTGGGQPVQRELGDQRTSIILIA